MRGRDLIREARRRAGLSQRELAQRMHTSQSVIARWESGATGPSFDTVVRVARACGFELDVQFVPRSEGFDHDWSIAAQNVPLTPEERLANHAAARAFVERLQQAGPTSGASRLAERQPPSFRPGQIVAVLNRHAVKYLIVGGFAAVAHGAPHITGDLDITPDDDLDNLARLSAVLTELHARKRRDHEGRDTSEFRHDAASLKGSTVVQLSTTAGNLDIALVPSGTRGYADLRRDAVEIAVDGTRVLVASLADVIRSKEAANRPDDRTALPVLRRLLEEQHREAR
jgi:transcriptional regulator with XRE-family HTH domain